MIWSHVGLKGQNVTRTDEPVTPPGVIVGARQKENGFHSLAGYWAAPGMMGDQVSEAKDSSGWLLFAAVLYSPILTSLLRKVLPGQPSFLEPASSALILVASLLVLGRSRFMPLPITLPLLIWGVLQILYGGLSVFYSWKIGAVAFMTRVVPMLACSIAFHSLRKPADLYKLAYWAAPIPIVLLPIGFVCALFGNSVLPTFLQPLQKLTQLGLDVSKDQFHAFAGIFSTQTHLAYSMFLIMFLCFLALLGADQTARRKFYWWSSIGASILLSYLSTRRAVFLAGTVGLGTHLMLLGKRTLIAIPFLLLLLAGGMYFLELKSELHGRNTQTRSEALFKVDLGARIESVFIEDSLRWLWKSPGGTCLGCYGPEAQAFGLKVEDIEVGSHLLLAEMGIPGLFTFVVAVFLPMFILRAKSRNSGVRRAITVLLVYQVLFVALFLAKAAKIMTQVSMAQIFFWASYGIAASLLEQEKASVIEPSRVRDGALNEPLAQDARPFSHG